MTRSAKSWRRKPEEYNSKERQEERQKLLYTANVMRVLKHWEPHVYQRYVLREIFQYKKDIVMVNCGRKWGKTELMLYFLFRNALERGGGHYYLAPFQKQARELVWATRRAQKFCPEVVKSINNTEMRITLKNDSFIKLDGSDNYDAYRGVNPHSVCYDEFKDFKAQFHDAMEPNLATFQAPLLICGTPPDELESPEEDDNIHQFDAMAKICQLMDNMSYFSWPSWANPHINKKWLKNKKAELFNKGEHDVWYREYEAKRIIGGKRSIFPMLDKHHALASEEIRDLILKDKNNLQWFITADPGTTTVFAVLFSAVNPYSNTIYHLDELYLKRQEDTTTQSVLSKIEEIKDDLGDLDYVLTYDEAAAWFANEAMASPWNQAWFPTVKKLHDKTQGISLIKDQLIKNKVYISKRCKWLLWEMSNYKVDDKDKPEKKNDHLIDCLRYANAAAGITMDDLEAPKDRKPSRSSRPEDDWEDLMVERGHHDGDLDIDMYEVDWHG